MLKRPMRHFKPYKDLQKDLQAANDNHRLSQSVVVSIRNFFAQLRIEMN